MADFNITIARIRPLLGNRKALLEFAGDLPHPLDPAVIEYLEAHLGPWTLEAEEDLYFRKHPRRGRVYLQQPTEQVDCRERHPRRIKLLLKIANQGEGNLTQLSRDKFNRVVRQQMESTGETCFRVLETFRGEGRRASAERGRVAEEDRERENQSTRPNPNPGFMDWW